MLTRYDRIQNARERQAAREDTHPVYDLFAGIEVTATEPPKVTATPVIPAGYAPHHNMRREMVRRAALKP